MRKISVLIDWKKCIIWSLSTAMTFCFCSVSLRHLMTVFNNKVLFRSSCHSQLKPNVNSSCQMLRMKCWKYALSCMQKCQKLLVGMISNTLWPENGVNFEICPSVKLRGLNTNSRFYNIFYEGDKFCDFLFAFLHTNPLFKGIYSKRKEFAPNSQ